MRKFLEQQWYQSSLTLFTRCLLPLSWMFRAIISVRRFLYRHHFKKSHKFAIPVIIVGNITVGGTGKTPCVIWLSQLLRSEGYQPGIVSRGYGGKKQLTPYRVTIDADVSEVGDEAILMAKRTQCPLVVCTDRVAAVQDLLAHTSCNIVISDDGLQHYRLSRDIEMVIIDGMRELGNQQLLPAGPLREPVSRLQTVDLVVRQESDAKEFSFTLRGEFFVAVKDGAHKIPLKQFEPKRLHAVAAIGNPQRFFNMLREQGFDIVEHVFPDHHLFAKEDFYFAERLPIVMTEKDAVKCYDFADNNFWYIPVDAKFDEAFSKRILSLVQVYISSSLPPTKRGEGSC